MSTAHVGTSLLQDTFRFSESLTVFFPAFNDAPSLPGLLAATFETLDRYVDDYEVIVVNDGSSDETGYVLGQLSRKYAPHLRVVTHNKNQGYGAALRSGFREARKEYIFYTDGDGQYDPRELELLLRAARPGVGLVNGYKITRNDPWHRVAIGWLYNRFARWLFGIQLRDIDCDFRLIRRSAFEPAKLESTGGTICVELVRQLELSGSEVVELPVHHYARQHGRSQFFRVKSLISTFVQLLQVFWRLVVSASLRREDPEPRPSARWFTMMGAAVTGLSLLAYWRSLGLPFISDDYIQIQLARQYGPLANWSDLANDVLYRSRATSLVLTYWLEKAVGLDPAAFRLASLVLHIFNGWLILGLGAWRVIGWRAAGVAALFFAASQRHSEAVIWFAAVPELLVFLFAVGAFLSWTQWMKSSSAAWYVATLGCFVLALLSKESAVALIPLMGLALMLEHKLHHWKIVVPFAALSALYFAGIFAARNQHLHFNDGTFSLSAPFVQVLTRSSAGLLWEWGVIAMLAAGFGFLRPRGRVWLLGLAWVPLALLPYSFLTYMTRVPSRHTYLASVGLALIVGSGWVALRKAGHRAWIAPAVALLSIAHQAGYIWTVQHDRYVVRAQPTELLLESALTEANAVQAACFPYSRFVAEAALLIRYPERSGLRYEEHAAGVDLCAE